MSSETKTTPKILDLPEAARRAQAGLGALERVGKVIRYAEAGRVWRWSYPRPSAAAIGLRAAHLTFAATPNERVVLNWLSEVEAQ